MKKQMLMLVLIVSTLLANLLLTACAAPVRATAYMAIEPTGVYYPEGIWDEFE